MPKVKFPDIMDTLTGVRAVFIANSHVVGFASGVNVNESLPLKPLSTIDSVYQEDFSPGVISVDVTCDIVRFVGKSAKNRLGAEGVMGLGNAGALFAPRLVPLHSTHSSPETLTIGLLDLISDKVVLRVKHARAVNKVVDIKRAVVMENVKFVGVIVEEEGEIYGADIQGLVNNVR